MKLTTTLIFFFACFYAQAQTNTFPADGTVGIGTITPVTKLDVRGTISTPEIAFKVNGEDNSDPYRLRKVQSSSNENWLELQINDDYNESFRIYGNSCVGYGCGEYSGNLYHSFDVSGNVYHKGNVGIGLLTAGAKLTIVKDGTDPGSYDDNKSLFITGIYGSGQSYDGGIEFRHDNLTQGIGIGFNTIYQTGSNQNQELNLIGKGNGNITLNAVGGANGNIGIGTTTPDEKLTVKGKIHAEEVRVDLNVPGPDYVFADNYQLPSLNSIQSYIKENKHLPEVPSAKEMEKNGINLSEMNMILLKKVEELTLHLIEKDKELKTEKAENAEQWKRILSMEKALKANGSLSVESGN